MFLNLREVERHDDALHSMQSHTFPVLVGEAAEDFSKSFQVELKRPDVLASEATFTNNCGLCGCELGAPLKRFVRGCCENVTNENTSAFNNNYTSKFRNSN